MSDTEALLRRDQEEAILPEPADAAVTAAVVRRRLARPGPGRTAGPGWAPVVAAACVLLALVATAVRCGLDGYWLLLAVPMAGAGALPILLRKGV